MGTTESKDKGSAVETAKRNDKPIKSTENSNEPIKTCKDRSSRKKPKSQEKSPSKSRHEKKISSTKESSVKTRQKTSEVKREGIEAKREHSEKPRNGDVKNNASSQTRKSDKEKSSKTERTNPKRLSFRKQKERIEKEKKMQRVTKEQLRSLAGTLQRTSWYLGRRLGMDNAQATRYQTGFATEEERKYQILLCWRRVNGWKATRQRLVILLEDGKYTETEYVALLTSSNGDVTIYDKPPEIEKETSKPNEKRELYHSDVTTSPGGSYGNVTYGSTVEAKVHEKKAPHQSEKSSRAQRRKENEKRKSRSRSRESLDSTLPPWWNKSVENLNKPIRAGRSTEAIYLELSKPDKKNDKKRSNHRKTKSREHVATPDGNTSQTDDSGIVTSPPMSPAQTQTEKSNETENSNPLKHEMTTPPQTPTDQSEFSNHENAPPETIHAKNEIEVATTNSLSHAPKSIKREPNRSSNNLIVRRCSDSVVKHKYSSLPTRRPLRTHHREPPIAEKREDQYRNADDVTNYEVTIPDNTIKSRTKRHSKKRESKLDQQIRDDVTHAATVDVTDRSIITTDDVTNEDEKQDIKGMIDKYESLSRLNEKKKRESMAESIARYHEWSTLQGNTDRSRPTSTHYASKTSLNSGGSRRSGRGSVASSNNARHSRSRLSQYMQRYHFFTFGGKGRFPSRFKGLISGLAVYRDGGIIASDGENKRVQIFDRHGKFQTTFDTNTEFKPKGLCVTADEKIAVCCGDSVNVYDRDGTLHLSFGQGVFRNNCYCVCCDKDNNFYVTDIVTHSISIHDARGNIRKRFGFEGSSMIHFNQPVALAINSKNMLFITDSQNHCIKVYKLSGRPLFRIGTQGSADGLFWNPLGICIDHEDNLYVADCGNNRISQFNSEGQFLRHLLTEEDGLWMPSLVQINKHGQLVICEWEKQHIKVFTIETSI